MANKQAEKNSSSSGKNAAKKAARQAANEAQHEANLAYLAEKGITPRISSITKVRKDNRGNILKDAKGSVKTYTKSFEVKPSKLRRTQQRLEAGVTRKDS